MLNCLYDCRYCFLQGMYPSAHYLLFINFEDFFREIGVVTDQNPNDSSWFFSGYDCDSLALENLTGFVASAPSSPIDQMPFWSFGPKASISRLWQRPNLYPAL